MHLLQLARLLHNRQQRLSKGTAHGKTGSDIAFSAPNGGALLEEKLFSPLF